MHIGTNIRIARERLNMSQAELAKKLGYKSRSSINKIESGENDIPQSKVLEFANALGVTVFDLMGPTSADLSAAPIPLGFEPMPEMVSVPMVGRIACGDPITAEENIEDYMAVPAYWHAAFTLRCCGDSMEPTVHDGDLVAIRKVDDGQVVNGQIYAVRIDDEATLKHVYLYSDHIELRPENPAHESRILFGEDMNSVAIEGRAVGFCRNL